MGVPSSFFPAFLPLDRLQWACDARMFVGSRVSSGYFARGLTWSGS